MSSRPRFSFARLGGIIAKEFTQMRRDRLTFAMMLGIPLIQLLLFGFAINSDPRHLPAAVLLADSGPQGRTLPVFSWVSVGLVATCAMNAALVSLGGT